MNEQRTDVLDAGTPRGGIRASWVAGAMLALLLGCGGGSGSSSSNDDASATAGADSSDPDEPGDSTDPDGDGGSMDPEAECDGGQEKVTEVPLRRLSHVEYERSLQDLVGGVELPESELPPDLAVHGFENEAKALHPSALLIGRYSEYAAAAAEQVVGRGLEMLMGCDPHADLEGCAHSFVESFGSRAFRRPLRDDEVTRFTDFLLDETNAVPLEGAVQLTVEAFLQSPSFLYRIELDPDDAEPGDLVEASDFEIASRLSYFLWQSMPDDELFAAAAAGELRTEEQIEAQARRMLDDDRATDSLVDFHRQWLDFDGVLDQTKDPDLFPAWNDGLRNAMYEEAQRFVAAVFEDGHGTLTELLTSRQTEVNAQLAALYGVQAPYTGWGPVELAPDERAGVLTLPAVLASTARPTNGSPPMRGVFVLERILCRRPPDPPPTADTSVPEPPDDGTYTNRELFEMRTEPPECQGCHTQIDGIGFAFENYDSIGRFRTEDNGLPVDASGELYGTGEEDGAFEGAIDLSTKLTEADETKACVAINWFRYARGREPSDSDACTVDRLRATLEESEGDLRELMVAMTTSPAFRGRIAQSKG